ncbi:MAG: AsmA family protein, partial [Salibacteraceae bacterium]|nr:AsmA family protein [Salibacteraceae bacterium]
MLKKIIIVFVAIIVLIIGAAIVLPIVFKDDLIKLATDEANKNLNATVAFKDIDVSLFTNFPDFTLSINEVSVKGKGQFDGVTLADIKALEVSLDLMSVINGSEIKVNSFGLETPNLHVIVLEDGTANYDITIPSDEVEAPAEE